MAGSSPVQGRGWRRRWLWGTGVAAVVVGMVVAAATISGGSDGGSDDDAEGDEPDAVASPEVLEASEDVAALAEDQGVSVEEATRRIERQDVLPGLDDAAAGALGEAYGGVWVDPTDGRMRLGVVGGGEALARGRGVVQEAGGTEAVDVVAVEHGLDELVAASDTLGLQAVALASSSDVPVGVGVRPDQNRVVLHLPADPAVRAAADGIVAEAQSRYGEMVQVVEDAEAASVLACSYPNCDAPLRGGVRITHSSGSVYCTAGFVARSRLGRRPMLLTAGHCNYMASGGTWSTTFSDGSAHSVGSVRRGYFSSVGDMAVMDLPDPAALQPRGWVYVTAGGDTALDQDYAITRVGRSAVGARVCITGSRSAVSDCGQVLEVNVTLPVCVTSSDCHTITGLTRAALCAQAGDSGGPIYASNTAYGLLSGGFPGRCEVVYQEVRGAERALNVTVALEG